MNLSMPVVSSRSGSGSHPVPVVRLVQDYYRLSSPSLFKLFVTPVRMWYY